jgi:hypothetical protein
VLLQLLRALPAHNTALGSDAQVKADRRTPAAQLCFAARRIMARCKVKLIRVLYQSEDLWDLWPTVHGGWR